MKPYYERDGVTLLHGDCREVLATLPAESVSCCISSPPFWGLRKYSCPPSIWGGDPGCPHRLDSTTGAEPAVGNKRQLPHGDGRKNDCYAGERIPHPASVTGGYAGRKRWQHDGVSRQETPEAWVKEAGHHQCGKVGDHSSLEGGSQRPEGDDAAVVTPESATCSLCGAWRGWYGLEPTVAMYVEHTIEVLRAIRRVLRKDGCCWWDLDDSRGGGSGQNWDAGTDHHRGGHPTGGWIKSDKKHGLLPKSLCLIPQRVAIAAQDDGWIVRSQVIIPSWMPESARDRPTDAYRVVLMLCKSRKYYYDAAAVRVATARDYREDGARAAGDNAYQEGRGRLGVFTDGTYSNAGSPDGLRSLGNIWADIPPSAYPAAHFATFPVEEPERCIKASCPAEVCVKCGKARVRIVNVKKVLEDDKARSYMPEGPARLGAHRDALRRDGHRHDNPFQETHEEAGWTDCGCESPEYEPGLVLDPFVGTGTTCVAAVKLGRRCIGIDASEEYLRQALTRLTVGDAGVRLMVKAERDGVKQESLL